MGLIDTLTVNSAVAAYGTRKLLTAYAGSCMRVRRSSDNAELDIGFDGTTGELDTVALLAYTGAGNGFVRTWYDQSGNGINILNATAGNQPRIVNAGVVELMDAKPAVRFLSASSTKLESAANAMANATYFAGGNVLTACAYLCATAATQFNLFNLRATADSWQGFNSDCYDGNFNVTRLNITGAGIPNTNRRVFTSMRTATALEYRVDGTLLGHQNNAQGLSTTFVQLGLSLSGTYYDGHIGELIVQASNNTSDRYSLELDQGSRYGVTIAAPAGAVSGAELVNAMLQTNVETTFKFVYALRTLLAVAAGNATGLNGANPVFTAVNGATNRVQATVTGETRTVTSRDGSLGSDAFTAPSAASQALANAVLAAAVEGGVTIKGAIRLLMAYLHGNATGLDSSPAFKSHAGSKTRITGTIDSGARTITTVDTTD